MKISTFNVNGIRAAGKKGFVDWVFASNPDIICLQELKAMEDQVPEDVQSLPYHKYWHSAKKKGYSGVAILSKRKPNEVVVGCGIDWIDTEGRVIEARFDDFTVLSTYFPSGTSGDVRQEVKYRFLDAFTTYINQRMKASTVPIILCGDVNIAHTEIDIHDPVSNKNTSGFLPEERSWMTQFLASGWADAFRKAHPDEKDLYSWWSYRARAKEKNKGWRIDYQLVSHHLDIKLISAEIEASINLSDHAPVSINYEL